MSSEARTFAVTLAWLLAPACADVRRGEYWDEPAGGSGSVPADEGDSPAADGGPGAEGGEGDGGADGGSGSADGDTGGTGGAAAVSFADTVLDLLDAGCARCHAPSGEANDTSFVLIGEIEADYASALEHVDLDAPASSRLLTKGAGKGHTGGVIFDEHSDAYATILEWIGGGAMP